MAKPINRKSTAERSTPVRNPLFVSSLARGLSILGCFDASHRELGVSEIAKMTGLPQPTAWRLCHTLREMGFLRGAANDKVRLGIPALGLGFGGLAGLTPAEIALPYMAELADRCGGAVSLGTRLGSDIVYIQRCQGEAIIFASFQVGSHVPILLSSTGWAYLAGLSKKERATLLAELKRSDAQSWAKVKDDLEVALRDYETRGFILSIGHMHPQLNAVSVPVRSRDGHQVLGLTCGGIASVFGRDRLEKIGRELIELASYLGLALPDGEPAPATSM